MAFSLSRALFSLSRDMIVVNIQIAFSIFNLFSKGGIPDQNRVDNKFYWVFAQSLNYDKQKNSLVQGGGQPQFNANAIKQIKIPLPHINIQQQIVIQVKKEQKAVEATRDLIALFEQKIKDKVSDVWGKR